MIFQISQNLKLLCANWKVIQKEFRNLNAPIMEINRVNKSHQQVYDEVIAQIKSREKNMVGFLGPGKADGNPKWLQYGLTVQDQPFPFVSPKVNKTMEMINNIKGDKGWSVGHFTS